MDVFIVHALNLAMAGCNPAEFWTAVAQLPVLGRLVLWGFPSKGPQPANGYPQRLPASITFCKLWGMTKRR